MRREREWANVLSCHAQHDIAYTWDTSTKALAAHRLFPRPRAPVCAVTISACGHFGFTATTLGSIDKFNLQSGLHRAACEAAARHAGSVRGLAADGAGRAIYSAGVRV